jgi:hypothetical protein
MLKARGISDKLRFAVFCTGIGAAMSSTLVILFILCLNLNGVRLLQYEANPIIATLEVLLLIMATATCFAASEIYCKYLKLKAETTLRPAPGPS